MKVCKFDPITGKTSFITQSQHQLIKLRKQNMKKKVIMCIFCKSIIHESNIEYIKDRSVYREDHHELVQSLKNGKTQIQNNIISFSCNQCGSQLGIINQPSSHIHIFGDKVLIVGLTFKQKKYLQPLPEPEQLKISCYSGLKITNLKKLLVKLMYLKCNRYQTNLTLMTKTLKTFLTTLNNFIQIFNAYKSEQQNSIQQHKKTISSFYKSEQSFTTISQHKSSHSHKHKQPNNSTSTKLNIHNLSDEIKGISTLSTTALNSSYRQNRFLSPIKQIVE